VLRSQERRAFSITQAVLPHAGVALIIFQPDPDYCMGQSCLLGSIQSLTYRARLGGRIRKRKKSDGVSYFSLRCLYQSIDHHPGITPQRPRCSSSHDILQELARLENFFLKMGSDRDYFFSSSELIN